MRLAHSLVPGLLVGLGLAVVLTATSRAAPKKPKPITNSIGMKLVRIPPGTFTMGSPKEKKGRSDDEQQRRRQSGQQS